MKQPKTTTPAVVAAQAFNRIERLRTECQHEIDTAPESIMAKYNARIAKAKEGLSAEALALLERMVG